MTDTLKTRNLVAEYLKIERQIAGRLQRMEAIKAELRDAAPHGKTAFDKVGHVTISDNVTYPEAVVLLGLTPGQQRRCMSLKYDSKKARANYPQNFESAKTEGPLKVSVKAL